MRSFGKSLGFIIFLTFLFTVLPIGKTNVLAATNEWETVGSAGFSAGEAFYTSLAIDSSGSPYVVYRDDGNSYKATVKKYNGSSWETVGSEGFSAGEVSYTSIAIDLSGTPYVVYSDHGNSYKATVKKYNGSSWVTVGSEGFSAGEAWCTSITLDGSGTPYVAYNDTENDFKANVKKYNGNSWETVGSAGFSAGEAWCISIALNDSGTPYVAYSDHGNSAKATVMKYNGSSWEKVGEAGFSAGNVGFPSIKFDSSGTPYVAYQDNGNSSKATVMKYNGSSWETVGSAGFSAGVVDHTSLAINSSGTPYLAYQDYGDAGKATVKKYNGSSWVTVGSAGFSEGEAFYTSLAINSSGTPYLIYQDYGNAGKATVKKYGEFSTIESPVLQSASVAENGTVVVLEFDKEMAAPASGSAGFNIYFSITDKVVTSAQLDQADSKKIRLTLQTSIKGGEDLWLRYTPGSVESADGGLLQEIGYYGFANSLPHPILTTAAPPEGTVNTPYTHTFTATDGQTPYTFSIGEGLPSGLTLNSSSGVLSGIPDTAGTFSFGITVVDNSAAIDSRNYTITIAELPDMPSSPVADAGGPYTIDAGEDLQLDGSASYDPDAPYDSIVSNAWDIDWDGEYDDAAGVNPVISFNQLFDLLSLGMLTEPADHFNIGLQVTDTTGKTGTAQTTLVINPILFDPDPVAVGTASPTTVNEGTSGADSGVVTFSHDGSYHPSLNRTIVDYQWLFDVPDPQNINWNAYSWAQIPNGHYSADLKAWRGSDLNANPVHTYYTAGTYHAALRVVDNNNPAKTDTIVVDITVNPTLTITTSSLPQGIAGMSYSTTLSVNGGMEPYTWTASGLPSGLSMIGATGVITGTPAAAGTSTVSIRVTDGNGCTSGVKTFTLIINEGNAVVQFESSSYSVSEEDGSITINVTRSGNVSNTISLDYVLEDGSARSGEDYIAVSGTLIFEPDEVNKIITIPLVNDNDYEPDETFYLNISNPSPEAELGENSQTVITIEENDYMESTGTVEYLNFEGGFYGVIGDDGHKYRPVNQLGDIQAGDRVSFKWKEVEGGVGFQMWGKAIRILEIQVIGHINPLQGKNPDRPNIPPPGIRLLPEIIPSPVVETSPVIKTSPVIEPSPVDFNYTIPLSKINKATRHITRMSYGR